MKLMGKVAVTGGAGFIGSNLTKRLLNLGHEVVVVDDLSTGLITNLDLDRSQFHKISICDFNSLYNALEECETIFHFAARGSVPRSLKNPVATHEVNATGTLNVLEVARRTKAHVLFSSSSSVYGRNLLLPKDESMWLGPMTPYAASKLAGEGYVQAYASSYGVKTTLLRFFNVFGPNQRPDHEYAAVLPKWIWLAINGQPIEVLGDGTTTRDFTYIDSVLDVSITAMKNRVSTPGAVNVAFGNKISLNKVVGILKEQFPDLKVVYKESRVGDVKESQNNPKLLMELFPKVVPKDFDEALIETINWLRDFGHEIINGPVVTD
jgi:UDP-glucose 4-epimerase